MNFKPFFIFTSKVIFVHLVTYFIVGAIAYQLFTQQFYEGANPIFAVFMRTPSEPNLWSLLIAAVLCLFFNTLKGWNFRRRFLSIASLYLVFGFWASAVAAPGTIDGAIYMRPEITAYAHLMVQPEIVIQGLALGAGIAAWMVRKPGKETQLGMELKPNEGEK
jgi:hypothetical protein